MRRFTVLFSLVFLVACEGDSPSDPVAGDNDVVGGDSSNAVAPVLSSPSLDGTQVYAADDSTELRATVQGTATASYEATIDWGDETIDTIADVSGGTRITRTHQYTALGTFSVSVTACLVGSDLCSTLSAGEVEVECADAGMLDCDNDINNGCEIDPSDDPTNCGSCNNECDTTDDVCTNPQVCAAGVCEDQFEPTTVECRPATGPCDVTEFCDGAGACPETDSKAGEGTSCDDGIFCNGSDTCDDAGVCGTRSGDPCPGPDGDANCAESCDEDADACTGLDGADAACDDGLWCNGDDTCTAEGVCETHAGDPCPGVDGDDDCSETCDEDNDECSANDPAESTCDDGIWCNGEDTCDGAGACANHAGDPCPLGTDCSKACNEDSRDCTAEAAPGAMCNDGVFCNGTETCDDEGVCGGSSGDPCPAPGETDCTDGCNEDTAACDAPKPLGTMCIDGEPACDAAPHVCDGEGVCSARACWFVSTEGSDDNTGADWDNARLTVHSAAESAAAYDAVLVESGIYAFEYSVITLKEGVKLYGSFEAGEGDVPPDSVAERGTPELPPSTLLDAQDRSRIIDGAPSVVVDGFTLRKGDGTGSAAPVAFVDSPNVTLANLSFVDNDGDYNAALGLLRSNDVSLINVEFTENDASYSGAGAMTVEESHNLTLSSVNFANNSFNAATDTLGGIGALLVDDSNDLTLSNVQFTENSGRYGGAVRLNNANGATFSNVQFTGNSASYGDGGALKIAGSDDLTLTNVLFQNNRVESSGDGGGLILSDSDNVSMSHVTFDSNEVSSSASGAGLKLSDASEVSLSNVFFVDNRSNGSYVDGAGAAVFGVDGLTMHTVDFTNNRGDTGRGGGLKADGGSDLSMTDVTFSQNEMSYSASGAGAAIVGFDGVTLTNVEFSDNQLGTSSGNGAGLYMANASDVTLSSVTFLRNQKSSSGNGGGMYLGNSDTVSLSNVEFRHNAINGTGSGAGLQANAVNGFVMTDVVFENNSLSQGEGVGMRLSNATDVTMTRVDFNSNSYTTSIRGGGAAVLNVDGFAYNTGTVHGNGATQGKGGGMMLASITDGTISGVSFTDNTSISGSGGGGLAIGNSPAIALTDVTFSNNSGGTSSGGGLLLTDSDGATLTGVTFTGNALSGGRGAGMHLAHSDGTTLTNVRFTENRINSSGGGAGLDVSSSDNVEISDAVFYRNRVEGDGSGAGMSAADSTALTMNSIRFVNNSAESSSASGAGLAVDGGTVAMNNAVFVANHAGRAGGAATLSGTNVSLNSVSFVRNGVSNSGGAVYVGSASQVLAADAIFKGNWSTSSAGGAMYLASGSSLTMTDGSFVGNNASSSYGGAIYVQGLASAGLTNVSLNGNSGLGGQPGDAIYADITGTVVMTNVASYNPAPGAFGGGGVFVGNNSCARDDLGQGNTVLSESPFADLTASGHTWLAPGSTCVDIGDDAAANHQVSGYDALGMRPWAEQHAVDGTVDSGTVDAGDHTDPDAVVIESVSHDDTTLSWTTRNATACWFYQSGQEAGVVTLPEAITTGDIAEGSLTSPEPVSSMVCTDGTHFATAAVP